MARELDEIYMDPAEANSLELHVKNCVERHAALVRFIHNDRKYTWAYRVVIVPLILASMGLMWKLYQALTLASLMGQG